MANKIVYRTEDEVRDSAKIQLGFDKVEANVKQGTGQITEYYVAAEPPVRCGESHHSGQTEPPCY